MSVNHAKEFFKYILYFRTFLAEPHMANITPILKKKISNLRFISFSMYIFRKSLSDIGPRKNIVFIVDQCELDKDCTCYFYIFLKKVKFRSKENRDYYFSDED